MNITDIRLFHPETIDIEPSYRERASQLSETIVGEPQQWSTYIHGLAFMGFSQWIDQQGYGMDDSDCSLLNPVTANVVDGVCNLQINDFKVCLVATEHVINETMTISCAALDLPEFAAHLYILLEVWEEEEKVLLRGVVRRDQLTHYRDHSKIEPSNDWTYSFPLSLLELEPNYILHYLQKLTPEAIALPIAQSQRTTLTSVEINTILEKAETLTASQQPLWQGLSWQEGIALLECPELLNLLYQMQTQPEQSQTLRIRMGEVVALLTQTAVDTTLWLQNQLDELAQSLDFWTPVDLTPAMAVRKSGTFENVIAALQDDGLTIPDNSQPMYQDIEVNGMALRICSLVIPPNEQPQGSTGPSSLQWSLLTILGTQTGETLPEGTQLQVSNVSGVLNAPVLEFDEPFMYSFTNAEWGEKLVVTIVMDQTAKTLTPYVFGPQGGEQ